MVSTTVLYERMSTAVDASQQNDIQAIFGEYGENYGGSPAVLDRILAFAGTDNPFDAVQNVVEVRPPVFRRKCETDRKVIGISESGQTLTRAAFPISSQHSPEEGVKYLGTVAITQLYQAFGTESQKQATRRTEEDVAILNQENAPGSLDGYVTNFLHGLENLGDVYSRLDKKRLEAMQDYLNELEMSYGLGQMKEVKETLERLARNGDQDTPLRLPGVDQSIEYLAEQIEELYFQEGLHQTADHKTTVEKGGMLLERLRRGYKNLPTRIRDDYTAVMSPLSTIANQEREKALGRLMAYAAVTFSFNRDSIVGKYIEDIEYVRQLPQDHPIVQDHGKPKMSRIRSILRKKEISAVEALRVIDAYPIDEIRRDVNARYAVNRPENIFDVMRELEDIFIEDGVWQDDSLRDVVPMKRLRTTYAGTILTREECAAVMDMLRMRTLAGTGERFMQAYGIEDFQDRVKEMQVIARKVNIFRKGETNDVTDVKPPEWRVPYTVPSGSGFVLDEDFEMTHGMTLQDFVTRGNFRFPEGKTYHSRWDALEHKLSLFPGIYNARELDARAADFISGAVTGPVTALRNIVSTYTLEDDIAVLRDLQEHPLVTDMSSRLQRLGTDPCIRTREVAILRNLVSLSKQLEGASPELIQMYKETKGRHIFIGKLPKFSEVRVGWSIQRVDGVSFIGGSRLARAKNLLAKGYSKGEDLPFQKNDWVDLAASNSPEFHPAGIGDTYRLRRIAELDPRTYIVTKSLVDDIVEGIQRVETVIANAKELMSEESVMAYEHGTFFDLRLYNGEGNPAVIKTLFNNLTFRQPRLGEPYWEILARTKIEIAKIARVAARCNRDYGNDIMIGVRKSTKKRVW